MAAGDFGGASVVGDVGRYGLVQQLADGSEIQRGQGADRHPTVSASVHDDLPVAAANLGAPRESQEIDKPSRLGAETSIGIKGKAPFGAGSICRVESLASRSGISLTTRDSSLITMAWTACAFLVIGYDGNQGYTVSARKMIEASRDREQCNFLHGFSWFHAETLTFDDRSCNF